MRLISATAPQAKLNWQPLREFAFMLQGHRVPEMSVYPYMRAYSNPFGHAFVMQVMWCHAKKTCEEQTMMLQRPNVLM